ncbi:MAG: hypothetical protein RJA81_1179, partial [Planctomycetota bacterium]
IGQQDSKPSVVQSPPLEEVMALDNEERAIFLSQRLQLHCNTCHSSEMIEQQNLTLSQWQAEVQKMVNWGSTLPSDYVNLMGEHLSRLYPHSEKRQAPSLSPELALQESEPKDLMPVRMEETVNRSIESFYQTQCANCHGPKGEGAELGIRLVNRPLLVHPEEFQKIVVSGRGIMPAFQGQINDDQIHAIRRWLLGRSFSFAENLSE